MPEWLYHLTRKSDNAKTGPCAVTTSGRHHCADTCPLKAGGCYGNGGPISLHWSKVTNGKRGEPWERHLYDLVTLPRDRKIRLNQVGDLPTAEKILELGYALKNRIAWTYTHHRDQKRLAAVRKVNTTRHGLVINLSANNPAEADKLAGKGSPVVCMLPAGGPEVTFSPGGLKIVTCPEQTGKVKNCNECGNGLPLCARMRSYAIGFLPHGPQRRAAAAIAEKASNSTQAAAIAAKERA